MRRLERVIGAGALVAVLSGCSASLVIGSPPTDAPSCASRLEHDPERIDGPLVLTAQSVPTASRVPCLRPLPAGWTFHEFQARQGRARIVLDLGKANERALIATLTRHCDIGRATRIATDETGTRRFERSDGIDPGYRGDRFYTFSGGCVTYHFDVHGAGAGHAIDTISRSVGFLTRDQVSRYVHDYSDGQLELDPPSEEAR
jgi:hypothetical protein